MKGGSALDDFVLGTYYLGFYYIVLFLFLGEVREELLAKREEKLQRKRGEPGKK